MYVTDEKKATEFITVFIHFQTRGVHKSSLDSVCQFGQLQDQTGYLFLGKTGQVKMISRQEMSQWLIVDKLCEIYSFALIQFIGNIKEDWQKRPKKSGHQASQDLSLMNILYSRSWNFRQK